jgi:hypothetical protein
MCYNCGCDAPDDDMGHPDNITNHTFHHLGERLGKSENETKELVLKAIETNTIDKYPDLTQMFEKAAKAENQSVEEAKKETLKLLKKVLGKN